MSQTKCFVCAQTLECFKMVFTFNYKYLISYTLNDFNFKLVLFHCFRNAKFNISSVVNASLSSNQHNLAVLINFHLYSRIKRPICIQSGTRNYITHLYTLFGFKIVAHDLKL